MANYDHEIMATRINTNVTVKELGKPPKSFQFDNNAKLGGFLFALVLPYGDEYKSMYEVWIDGKQDYIGDDYWEIWDLGEDQPDDYDEDPSIYKYFSIEGYGHYYLRHDEFRKGAVEFCHAFNIQFSEVDEE